MAHDLNIYAFELPAIEEWLAGDDRTLRFQVVDSAGEPVDVSEATFAWGLWDREYLDDSADAILTGDDSGVEVVTDNRVNTENGIWEVRVDGEATEDMWGEYYHRPSVTQSDGTEASWRGPAILTA